MPWNLLPAQPHRSPPYPADTRIQYLLRESVSAVLHCLSAFLHQSEAVRYPLSRPDDHKSAVRLFLLFRLYKSSVSPLFVPRFLSVFLMSHFQRPSLLTQPSPSASGADQNALNRFVLAHKLLNHRNLAGYFFRSRSADYLTSTYTGLQINRFIYVIFKDIGMCLVLFQCQIG